MSEQALNMGGRGDFLRVAMRVLDGRERWHLTRVLMQAARRSGRQVVDASPRDADVIFVNPQRSGVQTLVRVSHRQGRPLMVTYGAEDPQAGALHLPRPAETRELLPLLEQLEQKLAGKDDQTERPAVNEQPMPEPIPGCSPVVRELVRATAAGSALRVELGDGQDLYVEPARGKVWYPRSVEHMSREEIGQRLASSAEAEFTPVDSEGIAERLEQGQHAPGSLEQLAWNLSLRSSPQLPDDADVMHVPIRVTRCPNFSRLPHSRIHVTWSVRMMRSPMTLAELVEQSPDNPSEALRYYNALLMAGLLRRARRDEKVPSATVGGKQGNVISRIRTRLAER